MALTKGTGRKAFGDEHVGVYTTARLAADVYKGRRPAIPLQRTGAGASRGRAAPTSSEENTCVG